MDDSEIQQDRVKKMINEPSDKLTLFFQALLTLEVVMHSDDSKFSTIATDGKKLHVNTQFISDLNDQKLEHCLRYAASCVDFSVVDRRNGRDPLIWNMAVDYVINNQLQKEGLVSPIEGSLIDSRFEDMTSEQVYDVLLKESAPITGVVEELTEE